MKKLRFLLFVMFVLAIPIAARASEKNDSCYLRYESGVTNCICSFESDKEQTVKIYIAVYTEDRQLKLVKLHSEKALVGANSYTFALPENQYTDNMQLLIWNMDLQPVCTAKQLYYKDAYSVQNGSLAMEAEDLLQSTDNAVITTQDSDKLSASAGVRILGAVWDLNQITQNTLYATVYLSDSEREGRYNVWLRQRALQTDSASAWVDSNSGSFYAQYYSTNMDGEFRWSANTIYLHHGANYIAYRARTKIIIDRLILTNNINFIPMDVNDYPQYVSPEEQEAEWMNLWNAPSVTPPQGHPRLYLTKEYIPEFIQNMEDGNVSWMRDKFYRFATEPLDARLDTKLVNNHNAILLTKIEARALAYVVGRETSLSHAQQTIAYMRDYLDTFRTPDDTGDITRVRGDVLVAAAIVYDWCYDALTSEDKAFFKDKMLEIIASKEIGWPPMNLSNLNSHGGEQEIFRDMLAAGIALYDEYPVIYNLAAGRMFQEMVPARLWLRSTGRFDTGNDYAECRSYSEMWADFTFKRMGFQSIFGNNGSYTMEWLLYSRMPYGAMMPDGDMYSLTRSDYETYYRNYPLSIYLAANLYNDSYLKEEFWRRVGMGSLNTAEQFYVLLFNEPGVKPALWQDLPLSRYTSYPLSGIIARTSWQEGYDADTAMAFMDMHEVWLGDHMHEYTGNFNIYYKGLLAMDTGTYNASAAHNQGYSRLGFSANTMLVYDPEETFQSNYSNTFIPNYGQQRIPLAGKPYLTSLAELGVDENGKAQTEKYQVAENVVHYLGPNPTTPQISYISGDLTKAYSEKVEAYTRSMVFVDTNDKDFPAAFVVYDKIRSADSAYQKSFLLHSQQEPTVNGNQTVIERTENGFGGKLVNQTLLPEATEIRIIGGENNEMFSIADTLYPPIADTIEGGKYRIEISPAQAEADTAFLNAMYVTDAGNAAELTVTRVSFDSFIGAEMGDNTVYFNTAEALKSNAFSVEKPKSGCLFLAGLRSGLWKVQSPDGIRYIKAENGQNAIYLSGSTGTYTLTPAAGAQNSVTYPPLPKKKIGDFSVFRASGTNRGSFLYLEYPTAMINTVPYIPVALLKSFGAEVTISSDITSATVSKNGNTAQITADTKAYILNGTLAQLSVAPKVMNNTLYISAYTLNDITGYTMTYKGTSHMLYAVLK